VRTTKAFLLVPAVAAACSQVLGIDGQYAPAEEATGTGGNGELREAGTGGVKVFIPPDIAVPPSGGAGGEGPGPPAGETGGAPIPLCASGEKWCGACVAQEPTVGCNAASCSPCTQSDPNGRAVCENHGACGLRCNDGYLEEDLRCVPMPAGAGGSTGSGGADGAGGTTGSGGAGTGGRPAPCDPLQCPACNRGFEGCCIPAVPGVSSRCGCFYFPPLCTARVG
jgi:hypothetical protein